MRFLILFMGFVRVLKILLYVRWTPVALKRFRCYSFKRFVAYSKGSVGVCDYSLD